MIRTATFMFNNDGSTVTCTLMFVINSLYPMVTSDNNAISFSNRRASHAQSIRKMIARKRSATPMLVQIMIVSLITAK